MAISVLGFLFCNSNSFIGKKTVVDAISVATKDCSVVVSFDLYISNKYICKIYFGRKVHRRYVKADTLLFICCC